MHKILYSFYRCVSVEYVYTYLVCECLLLFGVYATLLVSRFCKKQTTSSAAMWQHEKIKNAVWFNSHHCKTKFIYFEIIIHILTTIFSKQQQEYRTIFFLYFYAKRSVQLILNKICSWTFWKYYHVSWHICGGLSMLKLSLFVAFKNEQMM